MGRVSDIARNGRRNGQTLYRQGEVGVKREGVGAAIARPGPGGYNSPAYDGILRARGTPLSIEATRQAVLDAAVCRRDLVATLASYAEGRRTLDVGCTGARPVKGHTEASLARHIRIARAASECLGVDLDEEGVDELNRRGFSAQVGDACAFDLGQTFETIIAGELIEHLPDPAAFFRNMRRHLAAGGRLVISTCNPFCSKQVWKILRHGRPAVHSEHTAWYDPLTLMRLAAYFNFEPRELAWICEPTGLDLRMFPRFLRKYFAENFIVAFSVGVS